MLHTKELDAQKSRMILTHFWQRLRQETSPARMAQETQLLTAGVQQRGHEFLTLDQVTTAGEGLGSNPHSAHSDVSSSSLLVGVLGSGSDPEPWS